MSLGYLILLSFCSVLAILFTLSRMIGFKNVVKHSVLVDFLFSGILVMMFMGTFVGMMIAVMAGLMMAVFLTLCKRFMKPAKSKKDVVAEKTKESLNSAWNKLTETVKNFEFDDLEPIETITTKKGSFFNR